MVDPYGIVDDLIKVVKVSGALLPRGRAVRQSDQTSRTIEDFTRREGASGSGWRWASPRALSARSRTLGWAEFSTNAVADLAEAKCSERLWRECQDRGAVLNYSNSKAFGLL